MGVTIFRPGARLIIPGVQVHQTRVSAASSWWLSGGISPANAIVAYAPKGAASLAASYINLANPGTYNAAPGVAPSINISTGWGYTGSQYLATGIVASGGSWSVVVRFSGASAATYSCLVGGLGTGRLELFPVSSDNTKRAYSNGNLVEITAFSASGVMAVAGTVGYFNGVSDATGLGSAGSTDALYVGARHNGASADTSFVGNIQAVAIYNTILTAGQVASVSTAMNAL